MSQLWEQLHDLFDTDDGSLPDIEINALTSQSVANVYAFLRSRSKPVSVEASFWHIAEERDVNVDDVPNTAQLVTEQIAEVFHVTVEGLTLQNATIPALGIFVFPDSICLDYRMGREWGPQEVEALFDCLRQIQRIAPEAAIVLADADPTQQKISKEALQ